MRDNSVVFTQQFKEWLLKSIEFVQKCTEIWGYGWQTKAAKHLKVDRGTISTYAKGRTRHGKIVTIKQETADRLMGIWNNKKATD